MKINENMESLTGLRILDVLGAALGTERAVVLVCEDDVAIAMEHDQDCCETAYLADIVGDLDDLRDAVIICAREETNRDSHPEHLQLCSLDESFQWSYYIIQTNKGCVTLAWFSTSNGYYREDVDVRKITHAKAGVVLQDGDYELTSN